MFRLAFDKALAWWIGFAALDVGLVDLGSVGDRHVGIPYRDRDGTTLFIRTRSAAKAKDGTKQPKGVTLYRMGSGGCRRRTALLQPRQSGAKARHRRGRGPIAGLFGITAISAVGIPGSDAIRTVTQSISPPASLTFTFGENPTKAGTGFAAHVAAALA